MTPLHSCWFHELATKTCFYQTAEEEPEQERERESRDKSLLKEKGSMAPLRVNRIATALIIMSTRWPPTNTDHSFTPVIGEYRDFIQCKKEKGLQRLLLAEPFISKVARETLEEEEKVT